MPVFILQNQHSQFLNRDGDWIAGDATSQLFSSMHYDVMLNQLIELNAKDHSLRGVVVACELDSRGRPILSQLTKAAADKDPDIWIDEADDPTAAQSAAAQPEADKQPAAGPEAEAEAHTETEPA